jgi:hypothetical protein
MKSRILKYITYFEVIAVIFTIYIIAYNAYFGFNLIALSKAERLCDNIAELIWRVALGLLLVTFVDFMKLVVNFIISETKKHN